jgi:hypothetical protein
VDIIKDYFLETNPNPERKGCPDEATLQGLAEDRLPVSHPARLHLASCSECFAEYRGYRFAWQDAQKRRRRLVQWAAAALLVASAGAATFWSVEHHLAQREVQQQVAAAVPVDATVNLLDAGTFRGPDDAATPIQQVLLPAAVVRLSVILPRFSQTGHYDIRIAKDKEASYVVAHGEGEGIDNAGTTVVKVVLDLRGAKAGMYFLATVRGADNGVYYYPLKINQR